MYDILTPVQMRNAEQASVRLGVNLDTLMDNAGAAFGERILHKAEGLMTKNVVILAGSGNNGGDGFVAAHFLYESGISPVVILCCGQPKTELAKNVFLQLDRNIEVVEFNDKAAYDLLSKADIIADCVFGTGFHGSIKGAVGDFLAAVNKSCAYKIACDVPSGADSLNGQISENTFIADETVTFHRSKLGLFISPAKECCGRIVVCDIGIPVGWEEGMGTDIFTASEDYAAGLLSYRPENSHKGTFGRVALICGSANYPGAALICAESALRSGVGIVNLCSPQQVVSAAVCRIPECPITPRTVGGERFIVENSLEIILEGLSNASAAVIGCGLGVTKDTERLVCEIIRNAKCPLVIDADGINCLSKHIDVLKEKQTEIILTPHAAELARLCGVSTKCALDDMLGCSQSLADKYGITVHAKNPQTMTVSAERCVVTDFGCSALAKGGSGDMLAGLIGSLTAQGLCAEDACVLGDYIMGMSAKILCETASVRGVLATDIIANYPTALRFIENYRK